MSSHSRIRVQLEKRLAEISQRVGRIEVDLRREPDRDWVERASELENDEVLEGLDDLGRAEVQAIREALRRVEDGSYGFCVECSATSTFTSSFFQAATTRTGGAAVSVSRVVSTGHFAVRTTRSATLPSSRWPSPVRP